MRKNEYGNPNSNQYTELTIGDLKERYADTIKLMVRIYDPESDYLYNRKLWDTLFCLACTPEIIRKELIELVKLKLSI